jgi:hypothetical protein
VTLCSLTDMHQRLASKKFSHKFTVRTRFVLLRELQKRYWNSYKIKRSDNISDFTYSPTKTVHKSSVTFRTMCRQPNEAAVLIWIKLSPSQWPRCLRREPSSPARTLGSWIRIPLEAWISVCVYSVFVLFCV